MVPRWNISHFRPVDSVLNHADVLGLSALNAAELGRYCLVVPADLTRLTRVAALSETTYGSSAPPSFVRLVN